MTEETTRYFIVFSNEDGDRTEIRGPYYSEGMACAAANQLHEEARQKNIDEKVDTDVVDYFYNYEYWDVFAQTYPTEALTPWRRDS